MFTDIVGFTALAQTSESDALRLLERHNQLLRPFFLRFRGREVKTMGDSFLVEFESALEATTCAVEIQRSLRSAVPGLPDRERIRIRIGIHLGDVVSSNGDVFGDAVNIASRIEPLAEPGGICVSGPVYDQVQNKVDLRFDRVDAPELKNVQMPIPVYRIILAPEPPQPGSSSGGPEAPRRLAVLPLTNMSADPQDEFFADGLTEEIITELSRIASLRVIARTSVMRYKGVTKSVREIGAELRVGYVLEGSVRKAGNRIRITTQLIDAATEEHLWADRFDRELADIFAVQADIASSVAEALDLRLRPTPAAARVAPPNVEAYTLYLRGRFLWNQRTSASVQEAMHRFEEAIAIDPSFPLAHSGLADCYSILVDRGVISDEEGIPKARAEAEQGLALDSSSAEVHASLGLVLTHSSDFRRAEQELRAAIALNPGYAIAHHWLHLVLLSGGRVEEAVREMRAAEELDPLSPIVLNSAGLLSWISGHPEEGLRKLERALELAPTSDAAMFNLVSLLALTHRENDARARLKSFEDGAAAPTSKFWVAACSYGVLGDRAEASGMVERMRSLPQTEHIPPRMFGFILAVVGDFDGAYSIFLDDRNSGGGAFRAGIRVSPALQKFREDPRFELLVKKWEAASPLDLPRVEGAARHGT
ncbi:MAG: adenylate/guanylate cyclase domain-containing protein [Thermoplasmata archaeon]|nr:adenylate/guanylate cyclase domain-containing protein [Thermoplasmata archaeon]